MNEDRLNPILTEAPPTLEEDFDRAPTREEILEDIRMGIIQAKAGEGLPAREALQAMLQRIYGDAKDA